MTETLRVLVVVELLSLAALPLSTRAFARLPGAAAGMAPVLGLLLLTWLVWILASLGIPNGLPLAIGAAVLVALLGLAARRGLTFDRREVIVGQIVLLVAFLGGTLLVAFSPDVWGTEKPMDMMLVNATIVGESYPPPDPWLAGEQLNYYYVGHVAAGLLIRLTDIEPTAGYNLALAAVLALTATSAFGLGTGIATSAQRRGLPVRRAWLGGVAVIGLLVVIGNVRGGVSALTYGGDLSRFDWFAPSRVIPDTINEFPLFSFLVGDLHAHVIALPLTLLAVAFAVQVALEGRPRWLRVETLLAALSIGILYAVNSWSWPVAAGILMLALVMRRSLGAAIWGVLVIGLGILLVLPFLLEFDPNARGIGVIAIDDREPVDEFVAHHAVIYGALLWVLGALYLSRLRSARHPRRVLVWGIAALIVAIPLLDGARLGGFAILLALLAVALHGCLSSRLPDAERALWLLVAAGIGCLAGAEILYVRDEFDGGQFTRMNTTFKMGYQAWILLAIAGGGAIALGRAWLPRVPRLAWRLGVVVLIGISLAYTVVGTYGRKSGFADGPRLDGREWLRAQAPGDLPAIDWLREHAARDAVVLEGVGDDYSPFGNARVSTYSGRPTVLGWQGHELQWSHDIGTRRDDVRVLYTTTNPVPVRTLLDRYRVAYAIVGPFERTTYGAPGALAEAGREVFDRDGTAIYAFDVGPEPEPQPEPEATPDKAPPIVGGSG